MLINGYGDFYILYCIFDIAYLISCVNDYVFNCCEFDRCCVFVNCTRVEKEVLPRAEKKSDAKIIEATSKNRTVQVTEISIYMITLAGWIFFIFVILKFKKFLLNR